jgi:2-amino-4-hydroxy-6-hydroxymethyldihydropteridine diphosphokinase
MDLRAPVIAHIGLGANLGDASATVREAAAALFRLPHTTPLALSSLYRSSPVDAAGPDFINAVARVSTRLGAHELLQALQALEAAHGRRRPYRNAPRTLDLDLISYGDLQCSDAVLTLPHPRAHLRRFVLEPLAEVAPDGMLPGHGPLARLLQGVADQSVHRLPAG